MAKTAAATLLDDIYAARRHLATELIEPLERDRERKGLADGERHWSQEEWGEPLASTLEGQIVRLSDSVAYLNHDDSSALHDPGMPPPLREWL